MIKIREKCQMQEDEFKLGQNQLWIFPNSLVKEIWKVFSETHWVA